MPWEISTGSSAKYNYSGGTIYTVGVSSKANSNHPLLILICDSRAGDIRESAIALLHIQQNFGEHSGNLLFQNIFHLQQNFYIQAQQTVQCTPMVLEHTLAQSYFLWGERAPFQQLRTNHSSMIFYFTRYPLLLGKQKQHGTTHDSKLTRTQASAVVTYHMNQQPYDLGKTSNFSFILTIQVSLKAQTHL